MGHLFFFKTPIRLRMSAKDVIFWTALLREDTHKKKCFLVVGPLEFYPPNTNGLVVHATFFFLVL